MEFYPSTYGLSTLTRCFCVTRTTRVPNGTYARSHMGYLLFHVVLVFDQLFRSIFHSLFSGLQFTCNLPVVLATSTFLLRFNLHANVDSMHSWGYRNRVVGWECQA